MRHILRVIVIAAAVVAAHPVPARAELDEGQRRAADAYVKDCYAWAGQLTKLGEGMGQKWLQVLDGKQPSSALRTELNRSLAIMDRQQAQFKAIDVPTFAEMTTFKTTFVDYLTWERGMYFVWIDGAIKMADDKRVKSGDKEKAIARSLQARESEENVWKTKVQDAMKAVYAALKRK